MMAAGSQMSGRVVVDNNTGHAIQVHGCGWLVQVALASSTYHPDVTTPACSQVFTVPAGKSSYPVLVQASYLACRVGQSGGGFRACPPGKKPPALPAGDYHTALFQAHQFVPAPPAITVRVTPATAVTG
jgi:hypothetical protein